jgi:hypothetical protein
MPDPQAIVDEFHAELADMLHLIPPARSVPAPDQPLSSDGHSANGRSANGRCHAMTKAGQPCRNRALPHSEFCGVHNKQGQPTH